MSNRARYEVEFLATLLGVEGGGTFIFPVSTDIRAIGNTTTPLGAGATYPSSSFACNNFSFITGTCFADQSGTLFVDFSSDGGSNWDGVEQTLYTKNTRQTFRVTTVAPLARVRFTNTSLSAQTAFRLYFHGKLSE